MPFVAPPRIAFGRKAEPTDTPARTRATGRRMHAAKLAAQLLPELPAVGESIRAVMGGNYDLAQVIAATVKRHPVHRLRIATLCVNKRTITEVVGQVDAGTVGTLTVLVSGFFARHNRELFEAIRAELDADHPGSRIAAARSHCKIVLFDFRDDSTPLVFEGSANLRKNGDREQLTAIRDRSLHDWHAGWIDDLVSTHRADA